MKSLLIKSLTMLLISSAFTACQKEKQEDLVPEQSTTRDLGNGIIETSQRGPNGNTVIFSNWIQKTDPDWMQFGPSKWTTEIVTASLTDAVKNNGLILVYLNFGGYVAQFPCHSLGENLVLDYLLETGKITARYTYGGGSVAGEILNIKLRYILIPSSAFSGAGNGRIMAPVDYSDYNAVCEYYGIAK